MSAALTLLPRWAGATFKASASLSYSVKYESLAAVDLGSNSFHLQVGRVVDEQIYPLDSLREPVRLGAGLGKDKYLNSETQGRALEALARFGERLRGFAPEAVRAVGTNTLRVAKNANQFLAQAEAVLGFPIEVIFGREEARLIYVGVSHSLPPSLDRRLVVDIGGGSTEFIIGTGFEAELVESLPMGCVSYSLRYFPDGRIDRSAMKKAQLAASNEIQRIVVEYRATGWRQAVASSGTAKSIASVLAINGWCEQGISALGLEKLRNQLLKAGHIANLNIGGVRTDRLAILPGGVALMSAIFEALELHFLEVSEAALRQGVLYDLLGRFQHHDMRELTVQQFGRRYHIDAMQAERVYGLALALYDALSAESNEHDRQLLTWAARLHEIGLSIAHTGSHKHAAYILSNADMPGFSQHEQERLARIVLAHRGKLSKLQDLPARNDDWALIFCLRIAALIHRSRTEIPLPRIDCSENPEGFVLLLPAEWLEAHPLTAAALEAEIEDWESIGFELQVEALGPKGRAVAE
jgi:exopolyphosphatase / guanosine-5'-triphosphate,3'-diphosphate pyrophosphatase